MKIIAGLFFLFCFMLSPAFGQGSVQPQNDSQNAKIWHYTLQWIYADNNKTLPEKEQKVPPQVSESSVAAFENDLAAASKNGQDGHNFYKLLYQPVQKKLGENAAAANPEILINTIASVAEKKGRDTGKLKFELQNLLPQNTAAVSPEKQPENSAETKPVLADNLPPKEKSFMESLLPYISWLALLLAALALFRTFNNKSKSSRPEKVYASENSAAVAQNSGRGTEKNGATSKEISDLKKRLRALEKENETWRSETNQAIQNLQSEAYVEPAKPEAYDVISGHSANVEYAGTSELNIETDHLLQASETPKKQIKYTRVPDDGIIRERDLSADSRDTWSFMEVTVPAGNADKATFRINPHVNHALAINNSLDRLESAFEFARSANKATHLVNDADGELVKVPQGWKVTKRARIHLA